MDGLWTSTTDALSASAHAAAHASASSPLEGETGVLLAIGGGLVAGLVHVFTGPDHLAAVAPLAVQHGRRAWRAGWSWGTGHALGAAAVTALALALRSALPVEAWSPWSRVLVGMSLLWIGFSGARRALRRGDSSGSVEHHATHRTAYAVGMLHGVGGLAHLFAVVPALLLPSTGDAAFYLAAYCLSSIAAMTIFAGSMGTLSERLARAAKGTRFQLEKALLLGSSALAAALGVIWIGL
jgi:hypothetical protein